MALERSATTVPRQGEVTVVYDDYIVLIEMPNETVSALMCADGESIAIFESAEDVAEALAGHVLEAQPRQVVRLNFEE